MPDILDNIIQQMERPAEAVKVASAAPVPSEGIAGDTELQAALDKVASAGAPGPAPVPVDPVTGLIEKAAQLAGAEQETNIAEARMMGSALADGFLAKMASAEAAVKQAQAVAPVAPMAEPLAPLMAVPPVDPEIEKIAADLALVGDDVSLQKVAAEAGYQAVMEKAAEDFQLGHDAALQEVANVAYGEFIKGAAETEVVLRRAAARNAQ